MINQLTRPRHQYSPIPDNKDVDQKSYVRVYVVVACFLLLFGVWLQGVAQDLGAAMIGVEDEGKMIIECVNNSLTLTY